MQLGGPGPAWTAPPSLETFLRRAPNPDARPPTNGHRDRNQSFEKYQSAANCQLVKMAVKIKHEGKQPRKLKDACPRRRGRAANAERTTAKPQPPRPKAPNLQTICPQTRDAGGDGGGEALPPLEKLKARAIRWRSWAMLENEIEK